MSKMSKLKSLLILTLHTLVIFRVADLSPKVQFLQRMNRHAGAASSLQNSSSNQRLRASRQSPPSHLVCPRSPLSLDQSEAKEAK